MATLDDLTTRETVGFSGLDGFWRGHMIAPLPVTYADPMYVVIPDIDFATKWGPCEWPKGALSFVAVGVEVLVVFDNRQNPWVIGIA